MYKFLRTYGVVILLVASIILQLGGIILQMGSNQPNRQLLAQCDRIRQVRSQPYSTPEIFAKDLNNFEPKNMLSRADEVAKKAKDMEALEIKDENLKRYQSRYIKLYKDESQALRELAIALANVKNPVSNKVEPSSIDALNEKGVTLNKSSEKSINLVDINEQYIFLIDGLSGYCDK